jgi:hypothetical protein
VRTSQGSQLKSKKRYYVYIMASRSLNFHTGVTIKTWTRAKRLALGKTSWQGLAQGWGEKIDDKNPKAIDKARNREEKSSKTA